MIKQPCVSLDEEVYNSFKEQSLYQIKEWIHLRMWSSIRDPRGHVTTAYVHILLYITLLPHYFGLLHTDILIMCRECLRSFDVCYWDLIFFSKIKHLY